MLFQPIVYGLIFIGVYLMLGGLHLLVSGKQMNRQKRVNRRLSLLLEGRDSKEVLTILRRERGGSVHTERNPIIGPLVKLARHANVVISPQVMCLVLVLMIIVSFVLLTLFTGAAPLIRVLVSVIIGYTTLFLWLRNKAERRISLFEEQLPDALDLMVRSLRVGHPINGAVSVVAREMPDPIGHEFGLIADEATYGVTVNEALDEMAGRVPVPDLRFLAIAVNIQAVSGGNLAEILDGLSAVIRSRFKLFRKVRAITAEARWSGWFLSMSPVVALLLVQIVDPQYYDHVSDHPLFIPGAVATVILLIANVIFMRILVNIKV